MRHNRLLHLAPDSSFQLDLSTQRRIALRSRLDGGTTSGPVKGGCAHDYPDTCAREVLVSEDGRALSMSGSKTNPFTAGGLCGKANNYLDRVSSPDRVLHPLRRAGPKGKGAFEPVTWQEALEDIAGRLQTTVDRWGGPAVLPYSFAGNMGLVQYMSMGRRFFSRLGAGRLARTTAGTRPTPAWVPFSAPRAWR